MGLVQKAFSDIITFSRSSNATRVGPNGLIQYAPHNLILQSQTFDNASWTKTRSSITANSIAAPDGTVTADKLVEDTTASNTHQALQAATLVNGATYTLSVYAKAAERSRIWLRATGTGEFAAAYFDLSSGTVVSGTGLIQSVGNGWYRCSVTGISDVSGSGNQLIYLVNTGTNISYTGDGTSGLYLWGAQLAVGPLALDYTPTTTAAVYGPRFDYDPVTLAARGLLVEEQRTNLLTYSEMFADASWVKTSATVTANILAAPDGTVTGDLIESTGAGGRAVQTVSAPSTSVYTYSVYLKKKDTTTVELLCRNNTAGVNYAARFNLDTLATSNVSAGATASVVDVGNNWRRCTIITASITSGNSILCYVYGGVGTSGENVYAWGAQLEAGSFATSYIPTVASTVTRSADVASVNTLSPWFNATEGTLYAEWTPNGLTGSRAVASANDGTSSELIEIRQDITDGNFLIVDSTTQANIGLGALTAGSTAKVAGAYKLNDVAAVLNGGTVQTDTAATLPTVTALELGARGGVYLSGHLRRVAFYPRRLSNSEIDALTS